MEGFDQAIISSGCDVKGWLWLLCGVETKEAMMEQGGQVRHDGGLTQSGSSAPRWTDSGHRMKEYNQIC